MGTKVRISNLEFKSGRPTAEGGEAVVILGGKMITVKPEESFDVDLAPGDHLELGNMYLENGARVVDVAAPLLQSNVGEVKEEVKVE